VIVFPAITGLGDAVLVTVICACAVVPTVVVTVAVLFEEFGSVADEATDTLFVITVPFATPVLTFTTIVNVPEVDPVMLVSEQLTVPVPPTPGVRQVHPAGAPNETNVVFAGTAVTSDALSAALGPMFVTICV
jgi:hypothetical protein